MTTVDLVEAGEAVCITRRGKPVARLAAVGTPRRPVDIAGLRAVTAEQPRQAEGDGEFVRRLRD